MNPIPGRKPKKEAEPKVPQPREVKSSKRGSSNVVRITPLPQRSLVTITWLCGGGRTFTPEELTEAIAYVDGLGSEYDMHLHLSSHDGSRYYVRLKDGNLTANDSSGPGAGLGDNGFVSWANLKKACLATINDLAKSDERKDR